MTETNMGQDERQIIELLVSYQHDETGYFSLKGRNAADKIVLKMEPGEMAYVPWFEVWRNGSVAQRINGRFVIQIDYAQEPTDE
jgi:hypothetical protein